MNCVRRNQNEILFDENTRSINATAEQAISGKVDSYLFSNVFRKRPGAGSGLEDCTNQFCHEISGSSEAIKRDVYPIECISEREGKDLNILRKTKKVRFDKVQSVQFIEPIGEEYYSDVWWQQSELEYCQRGQVDFRSEPAPLKVIVVQYIKSFKDLHQHVYDASSLTTLKGPANACLARGLQNGLSGLELYCTDVEIRRTKHIQLVVKTILKFHHQQPNGGNGQLLQLLSKSLSATDRRWAILVANAQL